MSVVANLIIIKIICRRSTVRFFNMRIVLPGIIIFLLIIPNESDSSINSYKFYQLNHLPHLYASCNPCTQLPMGLCQSTSSISHTNTNSPKTKDSNLSQLTDTEPIKYKDSDLSKKNTIMDIESKETTPSNPTTLTNSFMKRIANKMRSGTRAVHDFKPSINFLTIISSPTTHFDVYSRTLLTEVLRTISGQYCFLNMVDDVREQVLSCYFPNLASSASLGNNGTDSGNKRQRKPEKPTFWVTPLENSGLVGRTCKDGHAYNLEDVHRHRMFLKEGDWPPTLKGVTPTSFCIQPIRYMGDETRIIGAITVVNKDGTNNNTNTTTNDNGKSTAAPFSRRDVMQLLQICLQVSDSLYRQRIRAIESTGDSDSMALLAHYDSDHQDQQGRRFRHNRTLQKTKEGTSGADGTMDTIDENNNASSLSVETLAGSAVLNVDGKEDRVTESMGVSPMSRHIVGRLKRSNTSRNEASNKDLLVYQWPEAGDLDAGVWNSKDITRGLPENELGVPHDFRTLNFSALDYSPERLERFVLSIMRDTGMVDTFSIPPARLIRWTRAVRSSYQDNPFHNWYHGFSVCHFSYYQLYVSDISTFLHPLDVFGLLVAALCHDSDHPGLTNQHLIETEDDLTIHYNDVSVLENHHAYICCELLRREETKICCYLDRRNQKELRKIVITGKYLSEGAAREWSTVVDISIPPPSFKPVSLSLSRSPLSKTPKQVFFNPYKYI